MKIYLIHFIKTWLVIRKFVISELWKAIMIILIELNDNATVETNFSFNKNFLVENLQKKRFSVKELFMTAQVRY